MLSPMRFPAIEDGLKLLVSRCPRLARSCYWAGSACIATEELGHRKSYDLDFHTLMALRDVRPILAEVRRALGPTFETVSEPDEFGSGFRGVMTLPDGSKMGVEVLSNYEDVHPNDLVSSSLEPRIRRVTLSRYLRDKVQCVAERTEARDLADITAVLRARPGLAAVARTAVSAQDALLLSERLLSWTDEAVVTDLAGYEDIAPEDAITARELLLGWVRGGGDDP